jgi:hypothetical protein
LKAIVDAVEVAPIWSAAAGRRYRPAMIKGQKYVARAATRGAGEIS